MTSGENVADTTGIQAVFQAFQKKNKIDGSLKLPGLEEFTDEQLFFISFAGVSNNFSFKYFQLFCIISNYFT